jgi:hypothetical protein
MSLAAPMSSAISGTSFLLPSLCSALRLLLAHFKKGQHHMTKSLDVITEIIRNPKHPFRKADARPEKAQKHRYERRKIKEFMKLGNWAQEETVG